MSQAESLAQGYPLYVGDIVTLVDYSYNNGESSFSPLHNPDNSVISGEIVSISKTGLSIKVKFSSGLVLPFTRNKGILLTTYRTDDLYDYWKSISVVGGADSLLASKGPKPVSKLPRSAYIVKDLDHLTLLNLAKQVRTISLDKSSSEALAGYRDTLYQVYDAAANIASRLGK